VLVSIVLLEIKMSGNTINGFEEKGEVHTTGEES
jgi:hypothetical protein